ncbi:cellulose binding domain-containing protein [Rhizomonospora bruguierae]|uniref:cellulose binding domain-containing protein n=1 Tax=Rhizomonospora bruguierae TaxID=1581705 RepID=UPI001BCD8D97|nr:cellulose binding domain-containing protein [Micromonospora sp. NBRC 107566]
MSTDARPPRSAAITVLDGLIAAGRGLRRAPAAGLGAAIATLGTVALVVTLLRAPYALAPLGTGPVLAPDAIAVAGTRPPTDDPTTAPPSARTATPTPPSAPTATLERTTHPPEAKPADLAGQYRMEDSGLWGYRSSVVISNPGATDVTGWTLTITLPRESLTVTNVSGATARRDGATWTFTPTTGTRTIAGNGAATVGFEVNGAMLLAAPTACAVDGHACAGLTEN